MIGNNSPDTSVNIITLGCVKNLVDSEKLMRQLNENGFITSHNSPDFTDIIIINTCGFILDAKTESVETILSYVNARKRGLIRQLIVIGCLSERYKEALQQEIPEVDMFFGVSQEKELLHSMGGNYYTRLVHERVLTTPPHYSYLKISEGCNRNCSFCTIPYIRGRQVSRPIDELLKEAEFLTGQGVREILLIAQDLTSYGTDIYYKRSLGTLLNELIKLDRLEWIRLHYLYPVGIHADEIISAMKNSSKICKYLDLPIQHISDKILRSMNRGHGRAEIESTLENFRQEIPDIAIRTTLITGFPGETDRDFEELKEFIHQFRFDRLGVFTYSQEEGTNAAGLIDDVPKEIKELRKEEIVSIQENISLHSNLCKIGRKYKVIIDREEGEFYAGRTEYDSPEIDNEVLIPVNSSGLRIGQFYETLITDAIEYDLFGEVVSSKEIYLSRNV